jgi:hypothetical protein
MGASMPDTELRLAAWRDGSTQAERLAAAILRLSGYEGIDPQAPIGGPDGGKDILCTKGGVTWTGAIYFPPTPVGFGSIKKKFLADLAKTATGNRGFVFVTNRSLTVTQRATLEALGTKASKEVDIFHLERLRALLDAPRGYGVRLQFLGLPMTIEDQLAWFSEADDRVLNAVNINTRELLSIKTMIQSMAQNSADIVRTMSVLGLVPPPTPDLLSTANFASAIPTAPVSAQTDIPFILFTHRLACFDMPTRAVGVLRTTEVWLADGRGEHARHLQPPRAGDVGRLLEQLCVEWRQDYPAVSAGRSPAKLEAIARFHARLLVIHPFVDGNGRLARALVMQQSLDLFGTANMSLLEQGTGYYRALTAADAGDHTALVTLLKPVVGI